VRLGSSLPRNNFWNQSWQGSALRKHPKIWDPLLISATIEACNFKFGTQQPSICGVNLSRNNF